MSNPGSLGSFKDAKYGKNKKIKLEQKNLNYSA